MPTHKGPAALAKMHALNGAPWQWPTWQGLTGIRHGLFPDDDTKLPRGWTRQNAVDVQSFFRAYQQQPTEEAKLSFIANSKGVSAYPGREFWNAWVNRYLPTWGIHALIVEELREFEIHPLTILMREGTPTFGRTPRPTYPWSSTLLECLQMLVQRSWNNIRMQINRMRTQHTEIEAAALATFKADLEIGKPTKAKVDRAIRAVARWKECAELFNTPDNVKKAEDMLAELRAILEGLGAKLKKRSEPKGKCAEVLPCNCPPCTVVSSSQDISFIGHTGLCKVAAVDLKNLATEEDVSDLLNLFDEYFEQEVNDHDILDPPAAENRDLNGVDGDFGMELEAKMSPASLAISLGFRTGLPPSFNRYRHRSGITPWDDPQLFTKVNPDDIPEYLSKLRLHWHQLSGLHSIARSVFSREIVDAFIAGILIGDGVGLGKSAQAILFITLLMQVLYCQERNRKLPRIIEEYPYLAGKEKIPSLPHLIVCPGTLVAQWVNEIKTFLVPRGVDIFVYDSQTNAAEFWGPDGPLARSKHKPHNRIVVASHSALFRDMSDTHVESKKAKRTARPWDSPKAKRSLDRTIFGHQFLTVIVDEAHNMRNAGRKHTAALRLLQQATVRLIMTATPLHTSSKDIAAMGRLVGIPHFSTEAAFEEEREDASAVRRAKKLDDDGEAVQFEQTQAVKRLQGHLTGHFLRRTTESEDFQGNILIPLPPYKEIMGILNLTERERKIITDRTETVKAALACVSSKGRPTEAFYLEYRRAVAYAMENPNEPWPSFQTLETWLEAKSTKMDTCARICKHYLARDDVQDVSFADGQPIFPEIVAVPKEQVQQTRRILIYSEFASMAPLLQNVLQLYTIPSLAINGKLSFDKRDKQVKRLYDDRDPARVFIFSSVGAAGLNLSIADVVILLDQPWSAQDENQIRGRAWRQPQKKTVKTIHLLASDSADLLIHDMARQKRDMFDAFVNKELGEEWSQLLKGYAPDAPDADDADDGMEKPAPKPSKKAKQRRDHKKQLVVVDRELPEISEPDSAMASEGDITMGGSEPEVTSDALSSAANVSDVDEDHNPASDGGVPREAEEAAKRTRSRRNPLFSSDDDQPAPVKGRAVRVREGATTSEASGCDS
ncbi:putative aortic smooth muscle cell differentiation [Lyophyllum shimeji]|uniref:Aortic smooth muscle cell differentiation n=1 Tax=Lyophyllum shimeji TaxID=47721 RepID=A0A9P3PK51_LYOSH|nr:putative aortic smooth muscle cell differentiation [Lyophyllum shimeji]